MRKATHWRRLESMHYTLMRGPQGLWALLNSQHTASF
jgi:hypothetical protein